MFLFLKKKWCFYDWSEWVCDLGNDADVYFTTWSVQWLDVSEITPWVNQIWSEWLFRAYDEQAQLLNKWAVLITVHN